MYISGDDEIAKYYDAFLDGERVKYCHAAHVTNGWVDIFVHPFMIWDNTLEKNVPNLKRKYGRVELVNRETGKVIRKDEKTA